MSAAKQRMVQLMAAERLPYGDRTMTYNSRQAQELAKWIESKPGGDAIHDALFRAYFVDGHNIALMETLVDVAKQFGQSTDEAREILQNRKFQKAVDIDWERSRKTGITGVPTFLAGNQVLVGAQPYHALENLVIEAGAIERS